MAAANRTRVVASETFVLFVVEGDAPDVVRAPDGSWPVVPEFVSVREFSRCADAIHEARRHMALRRRCSRAEVWLGHSVMLWSTDAQDVTSYGGPVAPGRYVCTVDVDYNVTYTLRV